MRKPIQTLLLALASVSLARADIDLALNPVGGAIAGYAGQTIGWGFTFSNSANDYALVTSATYLNDPTQGSVVGTFTDFISQFQFVLAGPGSASITQAFDLTQQEGTGSFLIDPSAPVGAHSGGSILLTYDVYSLSPFDPAFDPTIDLIASGQTISADASIDVTASPPPTSTPEPYSFVLIATIVAIIAITRRRKTAIRRV